MIGRALVLGGGGWIYVAWETGVLAGLADRGIDVRSADDILGTSAGAYVGTWIASGRDPRDIAEELEQSQGRRRAVPKTFDSGASERIFEAISQATADAHELEPRHGRALGALALSGSLLAEDSYRRGVEKNIGREAWPGRLRVIAVDADSGERRGFDATSGVPLSSAIAAAGAVPGLFPPIAIDGRRYIDGLARSSASADLAADRANELALVVAPLPADSDGPGIIGALNRTLRREVAFLEAAGVRVVAITLSPEEQEACGPDNMDHSRYALALHAGRNRGRREANSIRAAGW